MSIVNTAFYAKNVPNWERWLRLLVAAVVAAGGFVTLAAPWSWVVAGSALGFALTGLFGFCPACALAGRRREKR